MKELMMRWIYNYGLDSQDEILKIAMELLEKSEFRYASLMNFHKRQFLNLSHYQKSQIQPASILFSADLLPAVSQTFLPKGSEVLCESEEGVACIYSSVEDMWFSHSQIASIYFNDENGRIYSLMNEDKTLSFNKERQSIESNELHFKFYNLFDDLEKIDFTLDITFLKGNIEELLNEDAYSWRLRVKDQEMELHKRKTKKGIHFQTCLNEKQTNQVYELILKKKRASLSLVMKNIFILMNEIEEEIETFYDDEKVVFLNEPIFDLNLSIFKSIYIPSELFKHEGGSYKLCLYVDYQEHLQEPLLMPNEYKWIMKALPQKQTFYDVYCDQIKISYFDGEDWIQIPEVFSEIHCFKEQKRYIELNFVLPNIQIYEGVETGYFLRITLLSSQNQDLYPLRYHVPVFSKVQLHYSFDDCLYPKEVIEYNLLKEKTLTDITTETMYQISAFPYDESILWIGFDEALPPIFHLYLEMLEEKEKINILQFRNVNGEIVSVKDTTKGFAHNGSLVLYEGNKIKKTMVFSKKLYWLKVTIQTDVQNLKIKNISYNCMRAQNIHKEEQFFYFMEENQYLLSDMEISELQVAVKEQDVMSNESVWMNYKVDDLVGNQSDRTILYDVNKHILSFPPYVLQNYTFVNNEYAICVKYNESLATTHKISKGSSASLLEEPRSIPSLTCITNNYGYKAREEEEEQIRNATWLLAHQNTFIHNEDIKRSILVRFHQVKDVTLSYEKTIYNEVVKDTLFVIVSMSEDTPQHIVFHELKEQIENHVMNFVSDTISNVIATIPLFLYVSIKLKIKFQPNRQLDQIQELLANAIRIGKNGSEYRKIGEYIEEYEIINTLNMNDIQFSNLHIQVYYFKNNVKIVRQFMNLPNFPAGCMVNGNHEVKWEE